MSDSAASQANLEFGLKIATTRTLAVRKNVMPGWIHDRHSQGDQKGTEAAFQQAVEKSRLDKEALRAAIGPEMDYENSYESEDDQVDMIEDIEM